MGILDLFGIRLVFLRLKDIFGFLFRGLYEGLVWIVFGIDMFIFRVTDLEDRSCCLGFGGVVRVGESG